MDGSVEPVVSVASVSGGVSYSRGGDADDWRPASVGLPVAVGDRLYAARVAVPLGSGDVVRIDGIQRPAHGIPSLRIVDSWESEVEMLPDRVRDRVLLFQPRQSH